MGEVTILSLQGKALARAAVKLQQHCGEILENVFLLGTVKDRSGHTVVSLAPGEDSNARDDTGIFTPGLYLVYTSLTLVYLLLWPLCTRELV